MSCNVPGAGAPLRVSQLVLTNAFAGTEAHVALLAQQLTYNGVIVRLVCGDRNHALIEKAVSAGVSVTTLRLGTANLPMDWLAAYRAVTAWKPHIIHAHLGSSLLAGAMLSSGSRSRLVFTQHFLRPAYLNDSGLGVLIRRLAHRVIHLQVGHSVATTDGIKMEMIRTEHFPADRVSVVPLGIDVNDVINRARTTEGDVRRELDLPPGCRLLITPARLETEKDHQTLLAAMPAIIAKHSDVHLLLAGAGALEQSLKAQTQRLGLAMHVHFLGRRADVPRLLAQTSICVLPSFNEPFGIALLEAMAVGIPVVACAAGGPRDIVVEGATGLLVPPRDSSALSTAINSLLGVPPKMTEMGIAGRERVRSRFNAERMTTAMLGIYIAQANQSNYTRCIADNARSPIFRA